MEICPSSKLKPGIAFLAQASALAVVGGAAAEIRHVVNTRLKMNRPHKKKGQVIAEMKARISRAIGKTFPESLDEPIY